MDVIDKNAYWVANQPALKAMNEADRAQQLRQVLSERNHNPQYQQLAQTTVRDQSPLDPELRNILERRARGETTAGFSQAGETAPRKKMVNSPPHRQGMRQIYEKLRAQRNGDDDGEYDETKEDVASSVVSSTHTSTLLKKSLQFVTKRKKEGKEVFIKKSNATESFEQSIASGTESPPSASSEGPILPVEEDNAEEIMQNSIAEEDEFGNSFTVVDEEGWPTWHFDAQPTFPVTKVGRAPVVKLTTTTSSSSYESSPKSVDFVNTVPDESRYEMKSSFDNSGFPSHADMSLLEPANFPKLKAESFRRHPNKGGCSDRLEGDPCSQPREFFTQFQQIGATVADFVLEEKNRTTMNGKKKKGRRKGESAEDPVYSDPLDPPKTEPKWYEQPFQSTPFSYMPNSGQPMSFLFCSGAGMGP